MNSRWISLGLSLLGVGGVGLTSYLAIKGHEEAKGKTDKKEKLLAYKWAILSGVGTSACILGSHHVSSKEIAALTASCTYLAANRDKILNKVQEKLGKEDTKKISQEAALEISKDSNSPAVIEDTGHGKLHFIEDMFGREFYCSLEHVEWAEKMLNHMYSHNERVNYNTFYELLGLKKTRAGWSHGWPKDEDIYDDSFGYSTDTPILFENYKATDDKGEPVWVICVRMTPPVEGYLEMED